jgi:hypothetical protein
MLFKIANNFLVTAITSDFPRYKWGGGWLIEKTEGRKSRATVPLRKMQVLQLLPYITINKLIRGWPFPTTVYYRYWMILAYWCWAKITFSF